MRLSASEGRSLIDLSPLQAHRLGDSDFDHALENGDFDPFPVGGTSGAATDRSGVEGVAIADAPLTGFDGALPDYIREALQKGVHSEDRGLQDFLAIFDKRLLALDIQARKAGILVATYDRHGREAASILTRLLAMIGRGDDDLRAVGLLLPLLSKTRTLEGLRAVLGRWTREDVSVVASFNARQALDESAVTRLSARPGPTRLLGQGAHLGRFGRTPVGHISVNISVRDLVSLESLSANAERLKALRVLTAQYLREPVPVTFYATIKRGALSPPQLSARPHGAAKLGAYNMLAPAAAPDATADIKITQLSTGGASPWQA